MVKILGRHPSGSRRDRIEKAANYTNGAFQNVEPTTVMAKEASFFKLLRELYVRPKEVSPLRPLPHLKTNLNGLSGDKPAVVWFVHSSYLIRSREFTVLVDPVLSNNASPVRFFGKAFGGTSVYHPDDFPDIDLLLITHDHYDHLDYKTVLAFKHKVKRVVCSLGVGAHLEYWGFAPDKIVELNWWEDFHPDQQVKLTATPARHFTGRGLKRAKTLWSSFVLNIHGYQLFLGGDSGYDAQFKKIGEQFGPFDLAFLECGQYGKYWPNIHMFPEQTVQAAGDLNAAIVFPVHWARFALSNHTWNEPIKRFAAEALKKNQHYVSPLIGETYVLGELFQQKEWWNL